MAARVKDILQQLLIAIMATAVGSGSLFVLCVFLWKFMMTWRHSHARKPVLPVRTPADAASGDQQPLPQADALLDVEVGPMNGGEVGESVGLPLSSSPDNVNAAEVSMEMFLKAGEAKQPFAEVVPTLMSSPE